MNSSNTPITAAGAETDYTRAYKKHFGQRPTAFALAERSFASSSFSSSSSSSSLALSTALTETVETHGPGNLDTETHNRLANLGWRIRSRINQGYSRTTTTLDDLHSSQTAPKFVSERDVLANVTNNRTAWRRVHTAPAFASVATGTDTFDDLRKAQHSIHSDTDTDRLLLRSQRGKAPKRRRDDSSDIDDDHDDDDDNELGGGATDEQAFNPIPLPNLSFSSSTSSASAFSNNPNPQINPHSLTSDVEMHLDNDQSIHWPQKLTAHHQHQVKEYDFSTHFNRTDF